MINEERRICSVINEELLNAESFPNRPFKKPDWVGLVFNRDEHGLAGFPREVFEAIQTSLRSKPDYEKLIFVPAVFPVDDEPTLGASVISGWAEYLAHLGGIDYFPEYYLVTPSLSCLIWVDSDASVVGGARNMMEEVFDRIGGLDFAMRRSAEEFGVDLHSTESQIASYIRSLANSG